MRPTSQLAGVVAVLLMASPSQTAASVTIGQVAPGATGGCAANFDHAQKTVASGNSYTVPATGGIASWTVTSWSTRASATADAALTMKVFRQVAGLNYSVVGHDGPRPLAVSSVNTFPANVPGVKPGDLLGLHNSISPTGCLFAGVAGDVRLFRGPASNLADGESGDFEEFSTLPNTRLNIAAVLDPTNTFTLGKIKRNENNGTATVTVDVPNPGELTASGKGVKAGSAGEAVISKTVGAAGKVKLKIKAKGKKKRTLNESGKVKVKPKVTYTPTSGAASTQTTKLKLKKDI